MNNQSTFRALAIAALVIAGAAAIGVGAYNAGVAQGIVESGRAIGAPQAGIPYAYVRPWGFGFFPFFPLLFLLLFFFVVRGLLWRSPGRRGCGYGYGYGGVPPAFDDWHRRAHGEQQRPSGPAPTTTT
jgi:hypothetical protein